MQMNKIIIILIVISVLIVIMYCLFFSGPEIRNPHPSGLNIICFGDSLTYGTGSTKGMDYPSQLSSMIRKPLINAGVPGDTTGSALQRLERDVLSCSPRIVLITLGGNDLKNGIHKSVAFNNLKIIIESIQDKGALVIMGGIDIPILGKGFGDAYKDLSRELGVVLVPNILEGIMGNPTLMSDQIHPNDAGYTKMARMLYEAIEPYLTVD